MQIQLWKNMFYLCCHFLVEMTFRDSNLKFIVWFSQSNKQIVLEFEIET